MRQKILLALVVSFLIALPIQAHTFNHGDRHETCEVDVPPHHAIDDGHVHFHHTDAAPSHMHGTKSYPDGHTHSGHDHDPCKQVGMDWYAWPDAEPLQRTNIEEAVINVTDPDSSFVITDFDAFLMEVPDFVVGDNLILVGDDALDAYAAQGGMTGRGTDADPYILEGHFLRNALLIKDTSKCVVIRDNVVHSRALIGPIFTTAQIIDLRETVDELETQTNETQTDLDDARQKADTDLVAELEAKLEEETEELEKAQETLRQGTFRFGGHIADSTQHLADQVVQALREQLPHRAGRMILDWNGQCVHAYNNIVEDLRVNQNNKRSGYATGGLLEDNQFFHIGQIRHYDGEFRDNVVGYKEHLRGFLPGDDFPPVPTFRTMNTDGFNQGWFHDNTFFGSVDLDFHGHHHGAGFFAPESHYHGSTRNVAYMVDSNGDCIASGHHHGHDDPLLDLSLLEKKQEECLPHHNHQLRWTSAVFEDNLVIDPFGYGLRYEDRNHQGDDRYANSEDMRELDAPHFHRTHIQIENNTVLGSVWVDIFNSPTVDVWSDDFSEVRRDIGGAIIGAVEHLGAKPIPSHPQRNDGWFELKNNLALTYDKTHNTPGFHYGWAAFQLNHIWEGNITFDGNQAFLVPHTVTTQDDADAFLETLRGLHGGVVNDTAQEVSSWGTGRSDGPVNFAFVFHHVEDSDVQICHTASRGFDVDVYAYNAIFDDSTVQVCSEVDHPAQSHIRYTPVPDEREPGITAPLRGLTDDSSFAPLMDHAYVPVEKQEDWARMQQANWEAYAEYQKAHKEAWLGTQLHNIDRWSTQQQAWADRVIATNMYWADYQAAQRMSWAEYQVGRYHSEAEYRAAWALSYAEWAQMMAMNHTYGVPV